MLVLALCGGGQLPQDWVAAAPALIKRISLQFLGLLHKTDE